MARKTPLQIRQVSRLVHKLQPSIKKAFESAIEKASADFDAKELVRAIDNKDVERVIQILRIEDKMMFPFSEAIRNAFMLAGASVEAELPRSVAGRFSFDGSRPRAARIAAAQAAKEITNLQGTAPQVIRAMMVDAIKTNRPAREVARDLVGRKVGRKRVGGILGLSRPQAQSIIRSRGLLTGSPSGMTEYLGLKLRDRRHDRVIKAAIKSGSTLPRAKVQEILEDHKQKALSFRSRLVARDEAFTAQALGRKEAYAQILEDNLVSEVTKKWVHGLSENPRPDHLAMDGTVVPLNEKFVFDDVSMDHPHDPAGGAEHSNHCRCTAFYRVQVPKG